MPSKKHKPEEIIATVTTCLSVVRELTPWPAAPEGHFHWNDR
jgi:hypothetical protein